MSRAGFVLVGGRSSRMGRDKALLPFQGQPLAITVAHAVACAAGSATLIGDPNLYSGLRQTVIPDLYPGEGPLGGILTALAATDSDWNLVAACDMPAVDAVFLNLLCEAAERSQAEILLPVSPAGQPEPLCAVYHRNCRPALLAHFERGIRKVTAAFDGIPVAPHVVKQVSHFQNVNTPEDWAAYAPV